MSARSRVSDVRVRTVAERLVALPARRIAITGAYGAGKSTFGERLAERLGVAYVDYDDVKWAGDALGRGPAAVLRALDAHAEWVLAGGEHAVQAALFERAALVIWLDARPATVAVRVVRRALARSARAPGIWNGASCSWRNLLSPRLPVAGIRAYRRRRRALERELAGREHIVLRPRDVQALLAG